MRSNFRPNVRATLKHVTGRSVTGQPTYSSGEKTKISIIKLASGVGLTSIRADKAGSKSRAEETSETGRVLVSIYGPVPTIDGIITIFDRDYKISDVQPRLDQTGKLNHYQIDIRN